MWSIEEIKVQQREAAVQAAARDQVPYMVWEEDLEHFPPYPFPFVGNFVPRGWKFKRKLFVDISGFGREGEPALTAEQFKTEITPGYGYAVIEQGQFQAYIGEFERVLDGSEH